MRKLGGALVLCTAATLGITQDTSPAQAALLLVMAGWGLLALWSNG